MTQFLIAHGFDVQDQAGRSLPAEELHARGAELMDALLDLAGGSTRFWSEPGVSPTIPNAEYRPDRLKLGTCLNRPVGADRVLDGVERTGEPVIITKYERPVAVLIGSTSGRRLRRSVTAGTRR